MHFLCSCRAAASRAEGRAASYAAPATAPNSASLPGAASNKRPRIGMLRRSKHFGCHTLLDNHALLHDGNAVADLRRNPQIMGDEQHREVKAAANVIEQLATLALAPTRQARRRLRRRSIPVAPWQARGRWQCVGAVRRRTGAGSGRARPAPSQPSVISRRARSSACGRDRPKLIGPSMIEAPTVRRGI